MKRDEPVAWMVQYENGNYEIFKSEHEAASVAARFDSEPIPLSPSSAGRETVKYARWPDLDKRINNGDDFAGDAWVRWTAVGHKPEDAA